MTHLLSNVFSSQSFLSHGSCLCSGGEAVSAAAHLTRIKGWLLWSYWCFIQKGTMVEDCSSHTCLIATNQRRPQPSGKNERNRVPQSFSFYDEERLLFPAYILFYIKPSASSIFIWILEPEGWSYLDQSFLFSTFFYLPTSGRCLRQCLLHGLSGLSDT